MPHVEKAYRILQIENTVVTVMDILRFVNCMKDNFRMEVSFATIYKMLKSQVLWDVRMCQWGRYLPINTV